MKQLTLEELNSDVYANRDTVRQHAKRDQKEVYNIPLKKIQIVDGYNARTVFDGIEELAQDIKANGQEAPGTVIPLKNGFFALIKGERRFRALSLLASRGEKVEFKAFLADRNFNIDDLYFSELSTQHADHLKPIEVGDLIQRLLTKGYNQKQIAERTGRSASWVSNMISFSRESAPVKEAVANGKMSVSTVLKTKSTIRNQKERTEKIKTAAANSKGKVHAEEITGQDPKQLKAEKICKQICDRCFPALAPDTQRLIVEIIKSCL